MRLETRAVADLPDQIDVLGGFSAVVLADVLRRGLPRSESRR
jgi:hypothetical protein